MSGTLGTLGQTNATLHAARTITLSLAGKINALKASRSPDAIQQLQTDTIIDLYNALMGLQATTAPVTTSADVRAQRGATTSADVRAQRRV